MIQKFCYELHCLMYKWLELGVKLNTTNYPTMFKLLINGDDNYLRYCDKYIVNDMKVISKIIKKMPNNYKIIVYNVFVCTCDLYNFYSSYNEEKKKEMDILYYKAVISNFYMAKKGMFNNKLFLDFRTEFYQIGVMINNYYQSNDLERQNVISKMIKSKIAELFNRYEYEYCMPNCTL